MEDDAVELYARVTAAYAGCISYQDEGVQRTTFYSSDFNAGSCVQLKRFSTRFDRERGFLIEVRQQCGNSWSHHVIWNEGGHARLWSDLKPDAAHIDSNEIPLRSALARFTGVTGGLAVRVPTLLMPELFTSIIPRRPGLRMIQEPHAAAAGYLVLERTGASGRQMNLWIHATTYMIHRIVEQRSTVLSRPSATVPCVQATSDPHSARVHIKIAPTECELPESESVTYYASRFNAAVESSDLVFKPPAK